MISCLFIHKKNVASLLGVLFCISLLFETNLYSQTLWDIDIQDAKSPMSWLVSDGLYSKEVIKEGDFDGIQFIPTVGFVFYISPAEVEHLSNVYEYLVNLFGKENFNKDYISQNLKNKGNEKKLEASINDGRSFVFREWKKDNLIIRLSWNQYRFWIEVINRDFQK